MTNLIGQSLGRYHILEQLGEGGMATVYKAYDTRLEADVAVKVIRTERLAPEILHRAMRRFEREAKALAQLNHPNIVKVLDYGEYEGQPYLVMSYLPGGTLKNKMKGKPMPWQEAVNLLIPIARGLEYAHKRGTIHRDVKPSNILITESGEPILTDFGVAKILDEEATLDLTGTSAAVGTPEYMAPEQATSKNIDHRADIYALGIVLYEMVTGRKPFQADTPLAVLFKHASEPLPRPSQFAPNIPDLLEKVLVKALTKNRDDRYQSMKEMGGALQNLLSQYAIAGTVPRHPAPKKIRNALKPVGPTRRNFFRNTWLTIIGIMIFLSIMGLGMYRLSQQPNMTIFPIEDTPTFTPSATNTTIPTKSATATLTLSPTIIVTRTPNPTATFTPSPTPALDNCVMGKGEWTSRCTCNPDRCWCYSYYKGVYQNRYRIYDRSYVESQIDRWGGEKCR